MSESEKIAVLYVLFVGGSAKTSNLDKFSRAACDDTAWYWRFTRARDPHARVGIIVAGQRGVQIRARDRLVKEGLVFFDNIFLSNPCRNLDGQMREVWDTILENRELMIHQETITEGPYIGRVRYGIGANALSSHHDMKRVLEVWQEESEIRATTDFSAGEILRPIMKQMSRGMALREKTMRELNITEDE